MSLPKFLTSGSSSSLSASSSDAAAAADSDAQKECAIKVVIRARPLSDRELLGKTPVIVSVARTSVQVINPVVFLDPTFLEAISTPAKRVTQRDVPLALSAQGIAAAAAAGECRTFHFDRCFGVDSAATSESEPFAHAYDIDAATQRPNQELVFDEVGRDMIASAFQGFNCTVLAYGQTGSGKTHTMVGEKSDKGKGLIPRVCEALFTAIDERRAAEADVGEAEAGDDGRKTTVYSAHVSYCEIYKEKVNDLLDVSAAGDAAGKTRSPPLSPSRGGGDAAAHESAGLSSRKTLRVREHPATGPFVEGLSSRPVTCYADIAGEMLAGEKLRTVAATLMNPVSSRSHAVFTITFTQTTFDPATQTAHDKVRADYSSCGCVDAHVACADVQDLDDRLGGLRARERVGHERRSPEGRRNDQQEPHDARPRDLGAQQVRRRVLWYCGCVVLVLSDVLDGVECGTRQGGERVPYRDSTLTWLLKESLGGNAKVPSSLVDALGIYSTGRTR